MPRAKNEHNNSLNFGAKARCRLLFRHVFATMHEMLDDIMVHYPHAAFEQKKQYTEQLSMLKSISDTFIEEWLQFEEKMADFREQQLDAADKPVQEQQKGQSAQPHASGCIQTASASSPPNLISLSTTDSNGQEIPAIMKGQGYFKLFMFRHAAEHFQEAVNCAPDNNGARLFLAMTYMHLQEWLEAQRHFQLLVELTDHPKWQALGYNALGCIQAVRMNLEQAERYFLKAHETDPAFTDPLSNLNSCRQHDQGHLSLYFGSGQL
ncbi:hypothetical protein [Paenibacillus mendelii]|uniref:Tetratricopeptide repeat protein n=1 Tax=Paenibacillus mendelii TaxID=206163 RepID=A0ABV6JJV6_9BACL|nr:hypothetical protein [Paenibacillus mendelii]MCQ6557995.1 hypothetical protein [Paenibacillus mendelii]